MSRLALLAGLLWLAAPALASTPSVERQTLSNGALLQVSEQASVPMVIVDVLVDAGSRLDPEGQAGLANLTADLLTEGTQTRSAEQIHEAVDFIGASLSSGAGEDLASVHLRVLRKDLDAGLDLLADVLLRPSFPQKEVERRKTAILAAIRASEDNPGAVADRAFDKKIFAQGPYGHPVEGWPETVKKLSRAQVVDFYRDWYRPSRAIITVVGDIKPAEAASLLEARLQGWSDKGETPPLPAGAPPAAEAATLRIQKPLTQANIILGHLGVPRQHPDWYAITVMNHILGGGAFSSRLFTNVRTKSGLAYSVGSGFSSNKQPGSFKVTMQTKAASAADAIAKAREEIEAIRQQPVSEQELSEAKQYLTGSFPMRFDSNAELAGMLAQIEFYGLGRDYLETYVERINGVTAADVQRVAQEHLKPADLVLVVVGPE